MPSIAEVIGYILLIVAVFGIIIAVIMNSPEKGEIFIVPDESVPEKHSRLYPDAFKRSKYPPGMYFYDAYKVRNYG